MKRFQSLTQKVIVIDEIKTFFFFLKHLEKLIKRADYFFCKVNGSKSEKVNYSTKIFNDSQKLRVLENTCHLLEHQISQILSKFGVQENP